MAKPPKIDRKTLKQPDDFVATGKSLMDRIADFQKEILIGVIAICVGAAAYYGYGWWSERKLDKAWMAYNDALKVEEGEKRWEALRAFAGKHSGTRPGTLAAVSVADHLFEQEKKKVLSGEKATSEPIDWYTKAIEAGGLASFEKQLLYISRGKANELVGKWGDALSDYESASALEGEARGLAALNVGRALAEDGKKEQALAQYDKVISDFKDTEFSRLAKLYRRSMSSPLLSD